MRRAELAGVLAALALASAPLAACGRDGGEREGPEKTTARAAPGDSGPPPAPAVPLPQGVTTEMVGEGRRLFGTACVVCHGPDAGGTQLGPSLREGEWLHVSGAYPELRQLIQNGVPEPKRYPIPMPPAGGGPFTAEQVRDLAAYVYALSRGRAQAPADTTRAPGKR